jgi:hypothetical protein
MGSRTGSGSIGSLLDGATSMGSKYGKSDSQKRARVVLGRCRLALKTLELYMRHEGVDYREARTMLRLARRAMPLRDRKQAGSPLGGWYSLEYRQLTQLLAQAESALRDDNFHGGKPEAISGRHLERRTLRRVAAWLRRATDDLDARIADAR